MTGYVFEWQTFPWWLAVTVVSLVGWLAWEVVTAPTECERCHGLVDRCDGDMHRCTPEAHQ